MGHGRRAPLLPSAVFALLASGSVDAASLEAPRDYRFRTLASVDGLSDDDVRSIVQDHQGFMWFGTRQGGLNRYDGYQFKVYQSDFEHRGSLSHNFVWVLYEDRRGTLWVGTNGGGLDRYDRDTDSFVHYRHDARNPASLPDDNVKALFEDAAGVFWVGSDGGLSRFDRDRGTFATYRHDPHDPESLGDDSVRSILEDPGTGRLWLGTRRGGLNVLDRATGRFTRYRHDPQDSTSLSDDAVDHIVRDRSGSLWACTRAGLNRMDGASPRFTRYHHDPKDPASVGDDYVTLALQDGDGRLWFATMDGLDLFDPETRTFSHFRHEAGDPSSLGDSDLTTLYEDKAGALWIGTQRGGVSRLAAPGPGFAWFRQKERDPESLSHDYVQAVHVERAGGLWVGTAGGLNHIDGRRVIRLRHNPADPRSLSADDVRSLAEDAAGNLWAGTWGGGLSRYSGGSFTRFRRDPAEPTSLAGDFIDTVHPDEKGNLWIAVHGVGLDRFDGKTFTHFVPTPGVGGSLPSRYVLSIMNAGDGALWLGTSDMGLVHFDPKTGLFTPYLPDPRHPGSEASNRVHSIHGDSRGALWLGTDTGLFRFHPGSSRFTQRYTKRDGLPSNSILGLVGDDRGGLWLSTPNGLSHYSPDTGAFRNYDRTDGLPNNLFVARAQAQAADGRLYFGGPSGLVAFHPKRLLDNPHVPPVVLTDLELFDRRVEATGPGAPLRRAIHVADEVVLQPGQSVFGVRFAALDYTAPEKNRYAYRMEGFDPDWRYTGASGRLATYTNLDPGHYVLRVRGSNNHGVWNEKGASLRIVIRPPWWKTWWFRGLSAAVVLGLLFSGHRLRVRTLEERERRFRTLAEHEQDIVIRFDRDLRLLYISPAAEEHTRKPPSALIGRTCADLGVPAARVEAVEAALRDILSTGRPAFHEVEIETPRGHRFFEARLVPEVSAGGGRSSLLAIVRDVTERRQAEEERSRYRESLRRSQAMASMGALVAGVAHEVRNPLFTISATLDALEAGSPGENPYRENAEVLRAQVDRMNRLTQDLLAYGRPPAPELAPRPIDGVLAEALDSCQTMARGAGVRLEMQVPAELPLVLMDRSRLLQVFQNLIQNAIQHSEPEGLVAVTADAALDPEPVVRCSVDDRGAGFHEEDLPHLFEPFFTRRAGGTGLGLSIVQRIVEDHGGTISARNRPGGGARVQVSLPAVRG